MVGHFQREIAELLGRNLIEATNANAAANSSALLARNLVFSLHPKDTPKDISTESSAGIPLKTFPKHP